MSLIYGTAWKKDRTKELVIKAIESGFRAIDTANQPRHYNEPAVGKAIQSVLKQGIVKREDLFLQTKYTAAQGQDPQNIPFDAKRSISLQVQESVNGSLRNLGLDYIDSLLLHSPLGTFADTMEAWRALEGFVREKKILYLGISNCYDPIYFERLHASVDIKPKFIQNRFYSQSGYDEDIRSFCRRGSITYQSFWTLTGNPNLLRSPALHQIAQRYNLTAAQAMYKFCISIGLMPLDGTVSSIVFFAGTN